MITTARTSCDDLPVRANPEVAAGEPGKPTIEVVDRHVALEHRNRAAETPDRWTPGLGRRLRCSDGQATILLMTVGILTTGALVRMLELPDPLEKFAWALTGGIALVVIVQGVCRS